MFWNKDNPEANQVNQDPAHTMPRGFEGTGRELLPDATWPEAEEIAASYQYDGTQVFLGEASGSLIGINDNRHAIVVAGSRSGKGRSIIIPTLLEYPGSMLVIDPKGELASITANRREQLGQKVVVLNPFGEGADWIRDLKSQFNPMDILTPDSDTIIDDASLIADSLVVQSNSDDTHWDESARNLLAGLILHVATHQEYQGERNLVTVFGLLQQLQSNITDGMPGLYFEMTGNRALGGKICDSAIVFYSKSETEQASIQSTAIRNTEFLKSGQIAASISGNDFDLSELKTAPKGMTIYACLPASRMATHSRWFRLFINLAIEVMGRVPGKPACGQQTLFLMDEFHVLGHMQVIATAAALMAGNPYYVKLMPVLQDLPQLKASYEKVWETFLGNAGIAVFFGNNDMTTLEYVSNRLGKTAMSVPKGGGQVSSDARRRGQKSSSGWEIEVHDLLSPNEVAFYLRRSNQLALVVYADDRPFLLKRVNWDQHPRFKDKGNNWAG
jgi:type IV secretion system protein VirD4